MGRKQTPTHCCSSCHSPRVASYKQAFGAGDVIAVKLCPTCSITHALHPTPACPLWSHGLDAGPPTRRGSSQQLPIAPCPRSAESSGVPNAGHGKKGHSCLSAKFPAEGVPGGVDPVRSLPRHPLPKELRSQGSKMELQPAGLIRS